MQYQDCIALGGSVDKTCTDSSAQRLADANINPATGLATDYLNHFNEAIMLLELLPSCPDCRDDILAWRPMSYCEHFAASAFSGRDLAIAAYEAAAPALRARLDELVGSMNAVLVEARATLMTDPLPTDAGDLADRAATQLRLLAARAAALINGVSDAGGAEGPQAMIDGLMKI
jgi:hypothetical protein